MVNAAVNEAAGRLPRDVTPGATGAITVPRVTRFAWGVLAFNIAVILWGAFVRATGSGAGCGGHWPTCNGDVIPRAPGTATLIELSHRASSGVAFGVVMLLGVLVFLATPRAHPARLPALAAMAFMLAEVLIGAAIVLLGHVALDPSVLHGVFTELHAGNTFLLLATLTLTATHLGGCPRLRVRHRGQDGLVGALARVFSAVALTVLTGAIAALGDTLFPATSLADGLHADVSSGAHIFLRLRTLHPVLALVAFVLVLGACMSVRASVGTGVAARRLAAWAMVALLAQMAVGLVNLWLLVPIVTQLLHLLCADALFILLVAMAAWSLAEVRGGAPPANNEVFRSI